MRYTQMKQLRTNQSQISKIQLTYFIDLKNINISNLLNLLLFNNESYDDIQ